MNPRKPSPRQLEQLFQDLEDGTISADDHVWLMNLLRHDPEVREAYYLDHGVLAAGLHELAEFWGSEQEESSPEPVEAARRRNWRHSFMAAAALVALLALIGSLIAIHGKPLPPARVTAGVASNWRFDSGGIDEGGDFLPATRLVLERGTVEIETRHRTRMILEGPAILEMHSPVRATLSRGKGWFDVAKEDKEFTVLTERLRVIDLGTRFGVAVSAAADRVQVDAGRVRVESRFPDIPPRELTAGMAAEADLVGRTELVELDSGLFLRTLPTEFVAIHWSFDELENGEFPAAANGLTASPVRVQKFDDSKGEPRLAGGKFGRALDLTDSATFAASDFPGVSGSGARTVAFWFKGTPIERRLKANGAAYTPPVVIWGDPTIRGGSWSVRAHCASGIIGTQWNADGYMTAGVIGSQDIHDGRWHHIASVYTGTADSDGEPEVLHYIDGKRVATTHALLSSGIDTARLGDPSSSLKLAYDGELPGGPGNLPVMIDELHVVRAALDDAQVETLFRENRLDPGK